MATTEQETKICMLSVYSSRGLKVLGLGLEAWALAMALMSLAFALPVSFKGLALNPSL